MAEEAGLNPPWANDTAGGTAPGTLMSVICHLRVAPSRATHFWPKYGFEVGTLIRLNNVRLSVKQDNLQNLPKRFWNFCEILSGLFIIFVIFEDFLSIYDFSGYKPGDFGSIEPLSGYKWDKTVRVQPGGPANGPFGGYARVLLDVNE